MWKSTAGIPLKITSSPDDEWETDPDFINDVTEEEQRWGSRTVPGSGRFADSIDMNQLREEVALADALKKKKELKEGPKAAFGYGGKFGVEADRMDRSAVGHDYVAQVEKHASQVDYSTGFGGKFGVQSDRIDKCAVTYDSYEKLQKHASQKDYATGFGGKYGIQKDRQDKCALGWDHKEKIEKHESQTDYVVGFGGKFGVQKDRQDKSAVGYDYTEEIQKHNSQTDHKKGFGGKFGLENDRVDKSAYNFNDEVGEVGTKYEKEKPFVSSLKPSNLRAKFENMAKQSEEELKKRNEEEQERRRLRDLKEKKEDKKREETRLRLLKEKENEQQSALEESQSPKCDTVVKKESTVDATVFETKNVVKSEITISTTMQCRKEYKQLSETEKGLINSMKNSPMLSNESVNVSNTTAEYQELDLDDIDKPTLLETSFDAKTVTQKENNIEESKQELSINERQEIFVNDTDVIDTGYTAIALYDYEAGADDEISFDPDDVITHIEMIDKGWWRGLCKGRYGLFPANYVALQ